MPKNEQALPDGFMTVGSWRKEWASRSARFNTTTGRDCFLPRRKSGGGRRLYTDKDMIQLHQILSLKSLGFPWTTSKTGLRRWIRPPMLRTRWQRRLPPCGRRSRC